MGLFNPILKLIECNEMAKEDIVWKYPVDKREVNRGSKVTVREGQACIFCTKGQMADVFLPGFYTLDTDNIPLITKIMSWKYGFEKPFKTDIYFVNTTQFTNQKWGTSNPIILRDKEFGSVRLSAYGTYSFRVIDPYIFMKELSGTNSTYRTSDIKEWLKSTLVTYITDIIGEAKIPVLDMASNLVEFGRMITNRLKEYGEKIGIEFVTFNFENFSLPKEVQDALDQSTSLGILGSKMDIYTQKAQADAMIAAAKNPGAAGQGLGMGMGMGMGMNMANQFANMNQKKEEVKLICPGCGSKINENAKFCPECGKPIIRNCPKCGTQVNPGTKFCPECGEKL